MTNAHFMWIEVHSELARQLAEMKIPRQQQQAHRKQQDPT